MQPLVPERYVPMVETPEQSASSGTGKTSESRVLEHALPLALIATVLLPGLGHVVMGRRFKGLLFIVVLAVVIWVGLDLTDYCNFTQQAQERHPVMFVVQFLSGGPAAMAYHMRPTDYPPGAFENPKIFEIGVLFTCVAGLLNVLLLIDLAGLPARVTLKARLDAARKKREEEKAGGGSSSASGGSGGGT